MLTTLHTKIIEISAVMEVGETAIFLKVTITFSVGQPPSLLLANSLPC